MARIAKVFSKGEICGEAVLIFLTVGNWHKGYDRLVKAVDDLKKEGVIQDDIFGQIGTGIYKPDYFTYCKYCSFEQFSEYIERANVIISHAGMGTIGQAIKISKPVIVVPRRSELGEHFDDHQFTTAEVLESEHKVLVAREISELPGMLQQIRSFKPASGESGLRIIRAVEEFLNKLVEQKMQRVRK